MALLGGYFSDIHFTLSFWGKGYFMAFILVNCADEFHSIAVDRWNWRATVDLIKSLGLIEDCNRVEAMHHHNTGAFVPAEEAKFIGKQLQMAVLQRMRPGEQLTWDAYPPNAPIDIKRVGDNPAADFIMDYHWLNDFIDFCLYAEGFWVV